MIASGDDRGQSEVLGVVLLLGLSVVSVGAVVAAGSIAVDDTRTTLQSTAVENAMYRYDAAATEIAYGTADRREVSLGETGAGSYEVRPDAGWINVTHFNYSGDDDRVIANQTLGAVVYERGDTEIAYQGGGVFRRDGAGSVVLSSPPLAYRYPTFTAPLVTTRGGGSATGSAATALEGVGQTEVVYPNATAGFTNPISGGSVVVEVKSRYASAWKAYFDRMSTDVNVTRNGDRVRMELPTEPENEQFTLGSSYSLTGVGEDEHLIQKLNLSLDKQSSGWPSFDTMSGTVDGIEGEYTVTFTNQDKNGNPCDGEDPTIDATVEYTSASGGDTHRWHLDDAVGSTGSFTYDCPDGDFVLNADLTGSTTLNYTGSAGDVTFDQHLEDNNTTYTADDNATIDLLTNHYIALVGGDATFSLSKGSGSGSDGPASTGYIEYDPGKSSIVTYLRVTNATIETEVS